MCWLLSWDLVWLHYSTSGRWHNKGENICIVKFLKNGTPQISITVLVMEQFGFTCIIHVHRKDAVRMAKGVDPDQTAPLGAV